MSRYIDADGLPRHGQRGGLVHWADIEKAPSIDIVRCKECRHNYNTAINHGKMHPKCDFADWLLTENDYCSCAERRESE